jgi:hypothetical protein
VQQAQFTGSVRTRTETRTWGDHTLSDHQTKHVCHCDCSALMFFLCGLCAAKVDKLKNCPPICSLAVFKWLKLSHLLPRGVSRLRLTMRKQLTNRHTPVPTSLSFASNCSVSQTTTTTATTTTTRMLHQLELRLHQ